MWSPYRSVVVGDFDAFCPVVDPAEADAPLLIDSDAVLPAAIALESFETIARRETMFIEIGSCVQHDQLSVGRFSERDIPLANGTAKPHPPGVLVCE